MSAQVLHDRKRVRYYDVELDEWRYRDRVFLSPLRLPRWGRIAFFATLPISGPIWVVAVLIGTTAWLVTWTIGLPVCAVVFFGMWVHDCCAPDARATTKEGGNG